jgi:hypothetical protein
MANQTQFAGSINEDIEAYLKSHQHKTLLRFITCGSVDDGKSTLIGRLLYESKTLFEDQLQALETDSKKMGTQGNNLDFALLVDGLAALISVPTQILLIFHFGEPILKTMHSLKIYIGIALLILIVGLLIRKFLRRRALS